MLYHNCYQQQLGTTKAEKRKEKKKKKKRREKTSTHVGCPLCKAGRFSYGESPRTPPLEGTSLHRRNISVERPWGILSLFTTCLRLRVKSPCQDSGANDLHPSTVWRKDPTRCSQKNKTNKSRRHKKNSPKRSNEKRKDPIRSAVTELISATAR